MKWLVTAALLAAPQAVCANDADANAVYARLAEGYAALDPAMMESVYAPGATYLPQDSGARIDTRETIMRGILGFQDKLRSTGGSLTLRFRLVDRKHFGDVYVDNGYVRTTIVSAKGAEPRVMTSKFATVLARQPDGRWAIVTDAASDTPADAFDQAAAVPGLKFDR